MPTTRGSWFGNRSITTRLTLLFAIVSIIPVLTIGLMSLRISSESTRERGVQDRLNRLEFLDYRTVELVRARHRDTLLIAFDRHIRSYFDEKQPTSDTMAKRQLIRLYNQRESTSVMLLDPNGAGLVYGAQSAAVARIDASGQVDFDLDGFALFDRWADPTHENGEPVIPYERLVLALSDNRPVARLVVNVKESLFRALYLDYERADASEFFIVNQRGVIQSCSDERLYARPVTEALGLDLDACEGQSGYLTLNGWIVTYRHNERRGLYFLERTPAAEFETGFWPLVYLTVLVAVLCFAVCVTLGSVLSRSFTKPLYRLIERMRTFDNAPSASTNNEIAILSDRYGQILERLETVIGEYYEEQKNKKEAQIRALEFQINPHFLYNTLSTIIWLIDAGEGKTAIRVTKDLSSFFRLSISKGREYITLREELHHVALYIEIQKARYADSIFVEYDVKEDTLEVYTPKLILQPLVENSIMHAMRMRADKTCRIRVTARRDGADVLLEVRDNGDAITQHTIDSMNRFLRNRSDAPEGAAYGIGISNVHDRIVMSFGEGYGLWYSRDGDETVASLRIRAT